MKNEKLELSDIKFEIECLPEYVPYKGNCSAIGEETDKQTEDWIRDQLDSGNQWAWCCVRVIGRFKELMADTYLGGCSYSSCKSFMENGGYYEDMQNEILADLQNKLDDILDALDESNYKNKV